MLEVAAKPGSCGERSGRLTKKGLPCRNGPLAGLDTCMSHTSREIQQSRGFGGPQAGAGRPPTPRAVDVLRQRLEANIDRVLKPLFDGLEADVAMTIGEGYGVERVEFFVDHNTRMRAAQALLDRVYGRPRQTTEVTLESQALNVNVDLSGEDGRNALALLLRQRPAGEE